MDRFEKLNGGAKAALTVAFVLLLTGTLVLLAAEKTAAEKDDRGFLGVSVRSLDEEELDELGVKHGLRVAAVEKESAAAKAGIVKGDVIQSLNMEKIRNPEALSEIVRELPPGSAVKIGLWRNGKALEVKAILGKYERPKRFHWSMKPLEKLLHSRPYLGVNIMDLDEGDLASYFAVKAGEGVLITGVEKETPAAKAGLKPGDVIVQVGGKAVKESGDIHEALAELKKGDSVDVGVVRHGKRETVKAVPDFARRQRMVRIFSGGKDMDLEHLELPEMDIAIPDLDIDIPEPPDSRIIIREVREKLDRAREQLDHAHEKMDAAKIKIEKKLRHIGENYWI
jgi:membrane-associated protease RseP (regulator of RpoE activity)